MSLALLLVVGLLAPPGHAESFKAWAARASREEREKDTAAALVSYSSAISTWKDSDGKPAKAKVYCARAALRDRGGDEAGALEDYSDCLALDKKNAKAFHRRGQLRFKQGRTSPAIDDFYKAIALDIKFGAAYADRAAAYEKQGDNGFAAEDYRHACELGVKSACPKAKELAPARKGAKTKPKKPKPAPQETAPADGAEAAPPEADAATAAAAGAPVADEAPKRPRRSRGGTYTPKFKDCLSSLNACVDAGDAFGACVGKSPACEQKSVRGCCPGACLEAYRKELNRGVSEAAAFRDIFIPEASCAAPPKSDDDD
jgi:tetratricopeptide (TPR) repeat protein